MKKNKDNNNYKLMIIIMVIIIVLLGLYFISNYNGFVLYELKGSNMPVYGINGSLTVTKKGSILNISNIKYDESTTAKKISKVNISFYNKDDNNSLLENEYICKDNELIQDCLSRVNIYEYIPYKYEETFKSKDLYNFYDRVYMKILLIDKQNTIEEIVIYFKGDKYTNDGFFYKSNGHI